MKSTYDPDVDILYVKFSDATVLESEELQPDMVFDFDDQGRIVGIEIFNARERVSPDALFPRQAAE